VIAALRDGKIKSLSAGKMGMGIPIEAALPFLKKTLPEVTNWMRSFDECVEQRLSLPDPNHRDHRVPTNSLPTR
jgi:hypothetical protein